MSRQVQIDLKLFLKLCDYFFLGSEVRGEQWLAVDIRKELETKLDKMISRELFSKYKRAPTGEEREKARKEYLDFREIPRMYRTDEEYHAPEPTDKDVK